MVFSFLSGGSKLTKLIPCFSNTRRDGKALERFLQDYFDGNLKRYLKSEPIPESNDGPVKVRRTQLPQAPT